MDNFYIERCFICKHVNNIRNDAPHTDTEKGTDSVMVQTDSKRLDKALREKQLGYVRIQQAILIQATMPNSYFLQSLLNIYVRAPPFIQNVIIENLLLKRRKMIDKKIKIRI
ncbi:DUF4886 domain-containing protein [Leyella lascolaii]|uniref:DUF4886 domain-containing protein n=1 Tax=Leyella lascolaii TaxID=1776379 RepID=UPI0034A3001F